MQISTDQKPGPQLHQQTLLREINTYLAKIAVILQHSPGKMLTFKQLMKQLGTCPEDRKSIENNVRVCLSTHNCFIKIPVAPDHDCKKNYWKLDCSQVTTKMVRRHFKGILHLFPELSCNEEAENTESWSESCSAPQSPEPAACAAVQIKCEVKFSSPFSIESLLKRDGPSARASRPLSSVPVRVEQRPLPTHRPAGTKRSFSWDSEEHVRLHTPAGSFPIGPAGGSTYHRLTANGAAPHAKRRCSEPSFPVYSRASNAPYFTSPHGSYITYPVPAFTHNALRFWL